MHSLKTAIAIALAFAASTTLAIIPTKVTNNDPGFVDGIWVKDKEQKQTLVKHMESVTVEDGWVFIWANNAHYSCVGHTWVWKEDLGDVVWSGGILWTVDEFVTGGVVVNDIIQPQGNNETCTYLG
ncbi:MAG: hypothetical protein M1813_008332 [Trichoglossum hirsutum]|nr:MAG: hypothetical protein M1813_008332 [Trichoglossum hirsutum]